MIPAATKFDTERYRQALIPAYIDYCQTVSRRSMAISLETAAFLWWMCEHTGARNVCDLGSGFTSYTLRRYAAAHPSVAVTSVDDSDYWLQRTGLFLQKHGVDRCGLTTWAEWQATPGGPFDVIVHDFARGDLRNSSMWTAADNLTPDGVLIFDDAQHGGHLAEMLKVARHAGRTLYDAGPVTMDRVGRFAAVAA